MLSMSGGSGHASLVPVKEKLSVFPIEDDISCGSFVQGLYDVEVCYFYPYFVEHFVKNGCCILSNAFSASIERIIWFLSFFFLNAVYHVD